MKDYKRASNLAGLAFFIGFWFAIGASLGVSTATKFLDFGIDYVIIVDQPEKCEGGPCG